MLPLSIFIAGASFALAASSPSTATSSCCGSVPTRQHQQQIMEQYLDLWAGNYSLEHAILSPDVHLYQDRFPTGNRTRVVAPTSSREFVDFVKSSREGWKEYAFGLMNSAFDGYNVVIRWKLNANVGTKFKFPSPLKEGDYVTYNGTDILQLDRCSGKIAQIDSAQDLTTFLHAIGLPGYE